MALSPGPRAPQAVLALCRDQSAGGILSFDPYPCAGRGPGDARRRAGRARRLGTAMTGAATALHRTDAKTDVGTLAAAARRYGLSVAGPLAVSGAHFLASLVFLRSLDAAEFGTFSFVLVASAFAMSISGAGLVLPATRNMVENDTVATAAVFRLAPGAADAHG